MHLVGNNSSMQTTPLWSVGKFTFLHDLNVQTLDIVFCPSLLLVFIMKCDKMPCSLPHNHYCCSFPLPSPVCLPHLLICTCLNSSPIAFPPSSVLCWCLLRFFFVFGCIFYVFFFFLSVVWYLMLYFLLIYRKKIQRKVPMCFVQLL